MKYAPPGGPPAPVEGPSPRLKPPRFMPDRGGSRLSSCSPCAKLQRSPNLRGRRKVARNACVRIEVSGRGGTPGGCSGSGRNVRSRCTGRWVTIDAVEAAARLAPRSAPGQGLGHHHECTTTFDGRVPFAEGLASTPALCLGVGEVRGRVRGPHLQLPASHRRHSLVLAFSAVPRNLL